MSMGFLKKAIKEAYAPKFSLTEVLQKTVGGYETQRSHKTVHASDITKDGFCPREFALMDLSGSKPKDTYIPTALKTTFDMGNAVSDLFRENWAGQAVYGNWECVKCGQTSTFSRKPKPGCTKDKNCYWKYREVEFVSKTYGFSGSIDVIADLSAPKLFPVELKIMAPEQFEKLQAPLAEHRIRTALYLYLIEDSLSPYRFQISSERGKVFYVSRGYGKKNQTADGEILPFKEYDVVRDDLTLEPYLMKAAEINMFRETGKMPAPICSTPMESRAKHCGSCKLCFSDKYPANSIQKVEKV